MNTRMDAFLHWAPRVIGLLAAGFISLFALDVFQEGYGLVETGVALFMHLIPTFLLLAALVLGWRHPRAGGVAYLVLGVVAALWFRGLPAFVIVSLPAFVVGGLFPWDDWRHHHRPLEPTPAT